ncbi:MAG: hypothetical protein K2X77_01650 [Candidatus Obscuribacterales bacterium]|nr:hypothetical protein [Candidatus Obscuribacterales bacterium]
MNTSAEGDRIKEGAQGESKPDLTKDAEATSRSDFNELFKAARASAGPDTASDSLPNC